MKRNNLRPDLLRIRLLQCLTLASASPCPRRKFAALLLDEQRNVVLADAYNGGPRKGGRLCGEETCIRSEGGFASGTRVEIGCHHAEMNLICNAASRGVATEGMTLMVQGEPCLMCAKLIHHAGIARVYVVRGGYIGENGVSYLRNHCVEVVELEGPQDERSE
jgi:dCMP deaminase